MCCHICNWNMVEGYVEQPIHQSIHPFQNFLNVPMQWMMFLQIFISVFIGVLKKSNYGSKTVNIKQQGWYCTLCTQSLFWNNSSSKILSPYKVFYQVKKISCVHNLRFCISQYYKNNWTLSKFPLHIIFSSFRIISHIHRKFWLTKFQFYRSMNI